MGRLTMAAGCTKVHHNVGLSALARSIQEQQCESREAPPVSMRAPPLARGPPWKQAYSHISCKRCPYIRHHQVPSAQVHSSLYTYIYI